jgi:glyoxylase-like metal-dependent hydrolase (beta-lactamase superfamily II)
MQSISKRQFVISATAAGAAFGLDGPLAFIQPAGAQAAKGMSLMGSPQALIDKGFAKFKVGSIEVTQLYDGTWEKAHDAGFIKNASVDETKAGLKAAGMTDAYVPIPFTVTVVKMRGKTIMFDSGTGGQAAPTAGLISKNDLLKKAGIDPAKISTIIVTHFHSDHIFGLMAKDTNAQTFPNAEIIVPAAEYKYWTDPGLIPKLPEARQGLAKRIQATLPTWKNIKQVESGKEAIPGVRSVVTYGHTPGHTSYAMGSGRNQLIVLGDVSNIPALFVKNPQWHAAFDSDAAMAEQNRRKIFDRAIADKAVVTGYHFGMPGAGTIKKDGKGYAYVPVRTV